MTAQDEGARRRRGQGFTLIEVMISLGIMMIGAMSIIGLQTHAIRANAHARQLTVAMQIAQRWVERMKQDAHTWNQVATPTDVGTVLGNTRYLRRIVATPNVFDGFPNGTLSATVSNAFDYQGNDIANDSTDATRPITYCVAYRPSWVYFGRAMRVDIRVFWPRGGSGRVLLDDFPACDGDNHAQIEPGGSLFDSYHVVYLPVVIRMTPVIR